MASLDAATHAQSVWTEILEYLHKFHSAFVRQWFWEIQPVELNAGVLSLRAATAIQQQYLAGKCRDIFNEAAQAVTGALVSVNFITGENTGGALARFGDAYDDIILSPDYVFENFVTGPCNRLALCRLHRRLRTPRQGLQPALHPRRLRPRQNPPPPGHLPGDPPTPPEPASSTSPATPSSTTSSTASSPAI